MSNRSLLTTAALAALFCVNATDAFGQFNEKRKRPAHSYKSYQWAGEMGRKPSTLERITLYSTIASYHTNRITPYNEFNPGLMLRYDLHTPKMNEHNMTLGLLGGFVKNSNYDCSTLLGFHFEKKFGRVGIGLVAGLITYREDIADDIVEDMEFHEVPTNGEVPKTYSPHRGYLIEYEQTSEKNYTETHLKLSAKGEGDMKIYPAALPKISIDLIENKLGIDVLGGWHPKHGGLITGAVHYRLRKPCTYPVHRLR